MRYLHLNLKKEWFDMIAQGVKKEEYREIKPYWITRLNSSLETKLFDYIHFSNGYSKNCPKMKVELLAISLGESKVKWSGEQQKCYVLELGRVFDLK